MSSRKYYHISLTFSSLECRKEKRKEVGFLAWIIKREDQNILTIITTNLRNVQPLSRLFLKISSRFTTVNWRKYLTTLAIFFPTLPYSWVNKTKARIKDVIKSEANSRYRNIFCIIFDFKTKVESRQSGHHWCKRKCLLHKDFE